MLELKLLLLLMIANGAPVIAHKLFGHRLAFPLDVGARFVDGRPLFGPSKTIRGVVLAIMGAGLAAPWLGYPWHIGAILGGGAMLGDLLSSFIKRRFGLPSSSMAIGLDQVPESLIPLLVCKPLLGLSWQAIALVTLAFFIGELLLSFLLYKVHLRQTPY